VGESGGFGAESFRAAIDCSLAALRGIGARSVAIALPGRDIDRIRPDQAVRDFLGALEEDQRIAGAWVERVTIIDPVPATKAASGTAHPVAAAPGSALGGVGESDRGGAISD
jgi:hypothetical protein